jgi:hypothetical protein
MFVTGSFNYPSDGSRSSKRCSSLIECFGDLSRQNLNPLLDEIRSSHGCKKVQELVLGIGLCLGFDWQYWQV